MNTTIYSTHAFEKDFLIAANAGKHQLNFVEFPLNKSTVSMAEGTEAVSLFVNDDASETIVNKLFEKGTKYIALRSAGYNHVNLKSCKQLGIRVANVPAYSPYAVAEHALGLMLALNRKTIRANSRVHELNFSLDGLTGFDMNGKTVGIIGTGRIGAVMASILHGLGCRILATDEVENEALVLKFGIEYTNLDNLLSQAEIITLHLPLTTASHYMINEVTINKMKNGVMLINTSRGGLIKTTDAIAGLKTGKIGYLGLDVYEDESGLFFEDHSGDILQDEIITRLLSFKNVLITSHQGFLTDTALRNIAETTIENLDCFEQQVSGNNEI